jgi:hypothetical protein
MQVAPQPGATPPARPRSVASDYRPSAGPSASSRYSNAPGAVPVPDNRDRGDLQDSGSFLYAQTAEKAQLQRFRLTGIELLKRTECVVERNQVRICGRRRHADLFERNLLKSRSLVLVVPARIVDQNPAYKLRGNPGKVSTILPASNCTPPDADGLHSPGQWFGDRVTPARFASGGEQAVEVSS